MIDFTIAMGFISWTIMFLMIFGMLFLKSCIAQLEKEDSSLDDLILTNLQTMVDEYNSRKFAGRVLMVLWFGARCVGITLDIIFGKKEE